VLHTAVEGEREKDGKKAKKVENNRERNTTQRVSLEDLEEKKEHQIKKSK
jgi:hypothetical protein